MSEVSELALLLPRTKRGLAEGRIHVHDVQALVGVIELLVVALEEDAEESCAYGDGCPTVGTRHGTCRACRARRALKMADDAIVETFRVR